MWDLLTYESSRRSAAVVSKYIQTYSGIMLLRARAFPEGRGQ